MTPLSGWKLSSCVCRGSVFSLRTEALVAIVQVQCVHPEQAMVAIYVAASCFVLQCIAVRAMQRQQGADEKERARLGQAFS